MRVCLPTCPGTISKEPPYSISAFIPVSSPIILTIDNQII